MEKKRSRLESRKKDGWGEKKGTEAVVNCSCGTHLSPLLIVCDLYHTHTGSEREREAESSTMLSLVSFSSSFNFSDFHV